ncbi:ABC transporter permease [Anaerotignum lactatifermentans]|uniref:ABC transporter permease n=1 Tax=Anaerotignum lactatifermentans TaxID=160404 RepID=A0ABS2GAW2_9FIRM|nr:ABC transporter permease [Anaerotignum lactatifermentans]MBM6830039.1 ABC transporter permease [Anaerotignum lactatifermentans]MBM6878631.1 ABC transporter permease [Anaerotignum lactatifermentans]MBM6951656.1 ABC transporter permease [Anaerotignum lactatifermentans]
MLIFENIRLAASSIRANKMRSFLTMLGMIIGISSVIAIVSLGDTMRSVVANEYKNVGLGLAYVYINSQEDYLGENELFTQEEADRLKEAMGDSLRYVGFNQSTRTDLSVGRRTSKISVTGLAENPTAMKNLNIIYGRMLNDEDVQKKRHHLVLQKETAVNMFGTENAVGETVKIKLNNNLEEFLVVGVYQNTDSALMKALQGGSMETAYIPESILVSPDSMMWSVYMIINDASQMDLMKERIVSYFSRTKNIDRQSIVMSSASEEMNMVDSMLGSLSAVVGAIAAISLVVGGIGIMNIMLVSVTERTREIGIRKALGAKTKDILTQFLVEAAMISAAGGMIGTALGISVVAIGGMAFGITTVVKFQVIVIAVVFSAMVGLGFGLYPARKAAKADPVIALRYE